ncbi:MAG: hypothetical protein M3Z66_16070 [Chloroflexota bacterium]|nr:hypothetical protein [Chloroflexota bacterium]
MLDTVTYPDAEVAETINARFVPVQINTREEANQPLIERCRQIWTPDLRILGSDGFDYYQWNGYLPPFEYLPQLLAGQARACLRMRNESAAAELYQETLRRFPTSAVAPEALYYLAVSKYKASGDGKDLDISWRQLRSRFPESIWRIKQLFKETG